MGLVQKRQKSVWLWSDVTFHMTEDGKTFLKDLHTLHSFTKSVINERWEVMGLYLDLLRHIV